MRKDEFKEWLQIKFPETQTTVNNRISNCRNIEKYYGDLDDHFLKDRCKSIIEELLYSTEDGREKRPQRHKVPIVGNIVTGSATLKMAVKLFVEFRDFQIESSIPDLKLSEEVIYDENSDGGAILKELGICLNNFAYNKKKHKDITVLQIEIKNYLSENLKKFNWEIEYKPSNSFKDSIDIFGSSVDYKYKIVIELDVHRADQVAKKFISRSALLIDESIIFISLIYPSNKKHNKNECLKYFNYCATVSKALSAISNTNKLYTGIMLQ